MPSAFELNASVNLDSASLNASAKEIKQALGRITGQASEFQKSLDASTARVFAFGATTAVLNGVTQSFKKLVTTTVEVQKKLVEINSIFQATEATFNRFRNSIFQVAKETGQAFNTVAEGAAELARQGLSAEETAKRLKAALVLTRISGLDAEKSVKALTAAINGFASAGLTANQIVNKMVAVDTAFAVSAQDLAEAFSRAGSTAEDAGVSFNELLGLVTAVEQRTARGGAVIGNAFKSIFTRLARGNTIDQLRELGVEIDATQTGIQKLSALSAALDKIADPTKAAAIKELAGGVFQINVVSAALKDLSSETGIFAQAAVTASNATNEAFEKNAALNKTIAAQINTLVTGLTSLGEKIGKITFGPLLENLIGLATKFTEFLDKALDPEKGNAFIKGMFKAIGSFLSGPAVVIFTAAFIKIFALVAKFAKDGLKAVFQIGSQTQKIQSIEAGLVQLLSRDSELRKIIGSTTASQATKEQAIITAIQRENALLTQQAAIMRQLATAAAARGVTGFGQGGFTGRGGRRFNAGFRAEEAEARMLGAPSNVRGRYSQGTIGGQRFIMNSHETEIPNFARNGDSAVIPHYSRGFIPNYAKIIPFKKGEEKRDFFNSDGTFRSAKSQQRYDAADQAAKDAFDAIRPNARGAAKGPRKPSPLRIDGGSVAGAFMTPSGKGKIGITSGTYERGSGSNLVPVSWVMGSPKAFQQFSPDFKEISEHSKSPKWNARQQKAATNLEEGVITAATKMGVKYAKNLQMPEGKANLASSEAVRSRLEQGGNKGAYGAVRGLAGATFEAAIYAALGLVEYGVGKKKGDFDVQSDNIKDAPIIRDLFGMGGSYTRGDLKVGVSRDTVNSFAAKVAKGGSREKDYIDKYKKYKAAGGKAAGFIPNFNRIRGYGVRDSQIRVHRDSLGEPLAVTNTRDEPKGLRDAIDRERQGIGMAARGFIPNYARGEFASGMGQMGGGTGFRRGLSEEGQKLAMAMQLEAEARKNATKITIKYGKEQVDLNASTDKLQKAQQKAAREANKGTGKGGEDSEKGDGMGGVGLMMAFGGLEMVASSFKASMEQDIAAAEASRESRMAEIDSMNLSLGARQNAIDALDAEIAAVKESNEGLLLFTGAVSSATQMLMAMSALNMVTGGSLGRMGKGMAGMIGNVGKGMPSAMGRLGGGLNALRQTGAKGLAARGGLSRMAFMGGGIKASMAGAGGLGAMGGAAAVTSVVGIAAGLGVALFDLTKAVSGAADETLIYGKLLGGSKGKFQDFFNNLFGVGSKNREKEAQKAARFSGKVAIDQINRQVMGGAEAELQVEVSKEEMKQMIAQFAKAGMFADASILKDRMGRGDMRFTGDLAEETIRNRAAIAGGSFESEGGFMKRTKRVFKKNALAGADAVAAAKQQANLDLFQDFAAGGDPEKAKKLAQAHGRATAVLQNSSSTQEQLDQARMAYKQAILDITGQLVLDQEESARYQTALKRLNKIITKEQEARIRALSAIEKARKGRDEAFQKADLKGQLVSQLDVPEGPVGDTMRFVQGVERSKLAGVQSQTQLADLNKELRIAQAAAAAAQGVDIDKTGKITSLAMESGVRKEGSLDLRGMQITSEDITSLKDKIESTQATLNKNLLKTQADLTNAVTRLPKQIAEAEKAAQETRGRVLSESVATLGNIKDARQVVGDFEEARARFEKALAANPVSRGLQQREKEQKVIDQERIDSAKALSEVMERGNKAGNNKFFNEEFGRTFNNERLQGVINQMKTAAGQGLGGSDDLQARFLEEAFKPQKTALEKNTEQLQALNNRLDYAAGELGLTVDRTDPAAPKVEGKIPQGPTEGTFNALFGDTKMMVGVTLNNIAEMAGEVTKLQDGVKTGSESFNNVVGKIQELNVAAANLFKASEGKLKELADSIVAIEGRLTQAEQDKQGVEQQVIQARQDEDSLPTNPDNS